MRDIQVSSLSSSTKIIVDQSFYCRQWEPGLHHDVGVSVDTLETCSHIYGKPILNEATEFSSQP